MSGNQPNFTLLQLDYMEWRDRTKMKWLTKVVSSVALAILQVAAHAENPVYLHVEGEGEPVCNEVLARMNAMLRKNPSGPVCASDATAGIGGATEPSWRRLRLESNRDLFFRLQIALAVSDPDYDAAFSTSLPALGTQLSRSRIPTSIELEQQFQGALQRNGELYIWDDPRPAPEGAAMIFFQVRDSPATCPAAISKMFDGQLQTPRNSFWNSYDTYPVHLRDNYLLVKQWVPSVAGHLGGVTNSYEIYVVHPDSLRERAQPLLCRASLSN